MFFTMTFLLVNIVAARIGRVAFLDQEIEIQDIDENIPTDQPDASFTGPF